MRTSRVDASRFYRAEGERSEPIRWQRVIWGGISGRPLVFDVVREDHLGPYARDARDGMIAIKGALDAALTA